MELGPEFQNNIVVERGLNPGENVVVDSASFIRFCISTAARSGLDDMSNVTVAEKPPEFELDDSM